MDATTAKRGAQPQGKRVGPPRSATRQRDALRRHLEHTGVTITRGGYIACPEHTERTPSCHVYDGPEGGHLHCYGCGYHADAYTYLSTHGGMTARAAVELLDGPSFTPGSLRLRTARPLTTPKPVAACPSAPLPAHVVAAHDCRAAQLDHVPAALDGRGFSLADLRRLRAAGENGRAIIPIIGPAGQVLRLKVRKAPDESGARYAYADVHGVGTPAWCSPSLRDARVVLVIEGELNGMAAWCARPDLGVVGVAGTRGTLPLLALAGRDVALYADGDQPGREALGRWANALHLHRCNVSALAPWADGDACDIAGRLGRDELAERLA